MKVQRPPLLTLSLLPLLTAFYCAEVPLDTSPRVALDPDLNGVWRCLLEDSDAESGTATLSVSSGAGGRYSIRFQADGETDQTYDAYPSTVDGRTFLNVHDSEKPDRWLYLTYDYIDGRGAVVRYVDDKLLGDVDKSSAPGIRARLAEKAGAPELLKLYLLCMRAAEPG